MRWVIRAAVSGVVVAILFRYIPINAVGASLSRVSLFALSVSAAAFFVGHYLNAVKLRLLLGPAAPGLISACVRAQYGGLVGNLGLPGLAGGDLVRAAYLAPVVGLKRITVASVADRLIDTLTLLILIGVAGPVAGLPGPVAAFLTQAGVWLIGGLAVGGGFVLVILRFRRSVAAKLLQAWTLLAERRSALIAAVGLSLIVQTAFVLINVWLARQIGVTTGLAEWFVAWPLSKLVAVLPLSLGGIGVREATLVLLLAPYGAPREAVLASGILWQALFVLLGAAGFVATHWLQPRGTIGVRPVGKV